MLSLSQNVRLSVRLSVCPSVYPSICPSVCSLLRYRLNVFFPPLPEVGCPIFLEIPSLWGKEIERSGLRLEHFLFGSGLKLWRKKSFVFWLILPYKTTLIDGLETSGQRVHR